MSGFRQGLRSSRCRRQYASRRPPRPSVMAIALAQMDGWECAMNSKVLISIRRHKTTAVLAVIALAVSGLTACQSRTAPQTKATTAEAAVALPAATGAPAMPEPARPFDETPITPVETAGASATD